ncbi:hypothetical protein [Serratia marcescens]|uniref:hypothetical protein n=2 Tax=Serratia TaxID=613 RepID=UPI0027E5A59F|nr:hypothetical protein [Serratia marcescens]MCS3411104.1 hypothetical protein [Serratia marcescens]
MDTDLINYETMLAAKDSAQWAWWTMAATIFSVFISLATLGMAYIALDSWREQERLKLKMEFKRTVLELRYSLDSMPESWSYHNVNIARERLKSYPQVANRIGDESEIYFKKQALKIAFDEASKAWIMCGYLYSDTQEEELWLKFNRGIREYIKTGGEKILLSRNISQLCSALKVL